MEMKKLHIILFVLSFAVIGCKSKKEIAKIEDSTEIAIPFSGKQYENNKDFFRAKQVGESTDLATAKKIAEQNAKAAESVMIGGSANCPCCAKVSWWKNW